MKFQTVDKICKYGIAASLLTGSISSLWTQNSDGILLSFLPISCFMTVGLKNAMGETDRRNAEFPSNKPN